MKFLSEYRDPKAAEQLAQAIRRQVTRPWTIMEVCGGQTHAIVKSRLDDLLPREITLVHGPGCPVCVTPLELIDKAVVDLAAAGSDLLLVRRHAARAGLASKSLFDAKAEGADVRIVYSPLDALRLAQSHPDRQVVFFAVGFETTAPANAMAVWQADHDGVENFSMLVSHVLVPPAMEALLSSPTTASCRGFSRPVMFAPSWATTNICRLRSVTKCRSWSPASSRSTFSKAFT